MVVVIPVQDQDNFMRILFIFLALIGVNRSIAQNDLDAIRYSRLGTGGSARYMAMGGAFGALGADLSCSSTNPGALGLYKKGEFMFASGLRFTHNQGEISGKKTTMSNANFVFNSIGIALVWKAEKDPESRHVVTFANNQLCNFSNTTRIASNTNNNSIVKDMMNKAEGKTTKNLDYSYEGVAFNVFLIDTFYGKYFSFVDLKRTVKQTRDIETSGRANDLNFSYAYSSKDQFYFGMSLGIPKISYTSTTTHTELDEKDSMRVVITNTATQSFTTTYIDGLPAYYPDKLGFNSLTYTEFFSTNGSGFNVKLGMVARINDLVRIGAYYHSPTIFNLTDTYYYNMAATFDADVKNPVLNKFPEEGGYYTYKIITPSRYGASAGFVLNKRAAIGLDYELIDYRKAKLVSKNVSDFAGVNAVINSKYSIGHNLRTGIEYNVQPVMLRFGYVMQGSPFGAAFSGDFVKHTISLGFGFRTKSDFYFDFAWQKSLSTEDYVFFSTIAQKAKIKFDNSMLSATIGLKF